MAILVQLAQQTYTARALSPSFNVPAGTKRVLFTFTRVNWPVGQCATLEVFNPNGDSCGFVGFDGGANIGRNGIAASYYEINGGSEFLLAGSYTTDIEIKQTITTAVTGERF